MRKKQGSTLAELVIVLAVVAVMSVMVVSFTILCNGWVKIGIQRYRLAQDQRTVSRVLHEFVVSFDDADYEFSSANGNELVVISRKDHTVSYSLSYENNTLRYTLPDREAVYPVDHISDLIFLLHTIPHSENLLICCSVYYTLPAVNMQREEIHGVYTASAAIRTSTANG